LRYTGRVHTMQQEKLLCVLSPDLCSNQYATYDSARERGRSEGIYLLLCKPYASMTSYFVMHLSHQFSRINKKR
jgi:hypothetical protein